MAQENHSRTVTITPANQTITAESGENLLTLLTKHAILLRADCGGKGLCKKCLVELTSEIDGSKMTTACSCAVENDLRITIPDSSLASPHIVRKAEVQLPPSFKDRFSTSQASDKLSPSIAVDLGTTTIGIYLIDRSTGTVVSSLAVKNPQALYGDDVMSRISYGCGHKKNLSRLQHLATGAIEWAIRSLCASAVTVGAIEKIAVVGNPAMIHILLGVSPASIGFSPYTPVFYDARTTPCSELGMSLNGAAVYTLPQVSGFIGGDMLAAAAASEISKKPPGTLLLDLGTNGELMLKGNNGYFATSCATGPAFEGATLSSGIQAVPGAIDRVEIDDAKHPVFSVIADSNKHYQTPKGICGSGVISAVAAFLRAGIIEESGAFRPGSSNFVSEDENGKRFLLHWADDCNEVSISQKDIRNVQLGKAALISGIEFMLDAAGYDKPEQILVAGAFGSHMDKGDLLALGMLPGIDPGRVSILGNAAGAGAIMTCCDEVFLTQVEEIAAATTIINLADNPAFNNHFISRLSF